MFKTIFLIEKWITLILAVNLPKITKLTSFLIFVILGLSSACRGTKQWKPHLLQEEYQNCEKLSKTKTESKVFPILVRSLWPKISKASFSRTSQTVNTPKNKPVKILLNLTYLACLHKTKPWLDKRLHEISQNFEEIKSPDVSGIPGFEELWHLKFTHKQGRLCSYLGKYSFVLTVNCFFQLLHQL